MSANKKILHLGPNDELFGRRYVWQLPVRLTHWANALSITALFFTGLYIGSPILAPAGEAWKNFVMGGIREIHFIFAYVFLFGFTIRSYWFWVGNNYSRSGFPMLWSRIWWRDLARQGWGYLRTKPGMPHLGHNALAGLSYTIFIILIGGFQLVTGFALFSEVRPDGFWGHVFGWVIPMLGGPMRVRTLHHLAAWMFVVFFAIHFYIVLFDGVDYRNGLISSMISGFKYYKDGDEDTEQWVS
jgi:Ni/Fe-hydrogenase 1 B-type cytochrome subunit